MDGLWLNEGGWGGDYFLGTWSFLSWCEEVELFGFPAFFLGQSWPHVETQYVLIVYPQQL